MAFNVKEAAAERHLIMAKAARGGRQKPVVPPKPDSRVAGLTGGVMAPASFARGVSGSYGNTGRPAR